MIDRLRQMAIFAKTIDHGSFRGAAKELRLSPSVVSHHIAQLEESLGTALMYRSTRKLTLTREGERLLIAARKMMQAAEEELSYLSALSDVPSGELRLTAPSVLIQSQLIDRVAAFAKAYPRIQLSVDFSDTRKKLIDDGYDLAIRMGPGVKNSATTRTLFSVQRKLVAAVEYLAQREMPNHPHEVVHWDWVVLAQVQNIPLVFQHEKESAVKIRPVAHMYTNDATALYQLARAGVGLAVIPDFLMAKDNQAGIVETLLPQWSVSPIDVFAVWPANAPKHGLIHLVLKALSF